MSRWEWVALNTDRLAVPGGWVLRTSDFGKSPPAMIFIPDEYHSWDLKYDYSKPTTPGDTGPK